jgi:hypothetical protein
MISKSFSESLEMTIPLVVICLWKPELSIWNWVPKRWLSSVDLPEDCDPMIDRML